MNGFDFLFSLIGLLLGFVLIEILSGLSRALKARQTHQKQDEQAVRVGWLSLLLALFIMVDVASYWTNVWEMRERLTVGYDTVLISLLVAALYYFAASMVFPSNLDAWPNLDEWFWRNKRRVLLLVFAASAVTMTGVFVLSTERPPLWEVVVTQALYFGLVLSAALARGPRVFAASIGALLLVYGLYAAVGLGFRLGLFGA
ncbi:hypothetical protein [Brevundimonas guildfordensis]|jgi:hypothetical protein|uniref:Tripartite tricarboxylate transporter TctB family protein n=1 Tax=Brevundimonas guildfordensis TaxID=2762241 RepID=A0ABR8QY24_9CAUL|nr:hypothetical protein [Brevundimonas guildfordensis]MBD7940147.1 hypothetical protein [Brevundimonas guildfordensis]